MIYIIDDKRSRQRDYGWDDECFSQYKDVLTPIWNMDSLAIHRGDMLEENNVILFHESFLSSDDEERNSVINSLKADLKEHASSLYVTYFSGSKNGRFVDERSCMLPPDVLYTNLITFINKLQEGYLDLKYLAFGENFQLEETIRARLDEVNDSNVGGERVPVNKRILFAVTSEDEIEPPFEIDVTNEWDFFDEDVSDSELNSIVIKWLSDNQYDAIYIPLYFGNVYSDYMGLRLAMHIRMTDTSNRYTPIFIYGVSTYEEVSKNECFEVFKFQSVYLIGADNKSLIESLTMKTLISENGKDIDRILLNVPSNIGDNHSVANRWAMYRWCDMLKWPGDIPEISASGLEDSLYFKYLVAKFGGHDKFSKKHKYDIRIDGIEGKTILYVDDEYDKGWETLLRIIFESSNAKFLCFKGFDKKCSRAELIDRVKDYLDGNDADCYLIDLRLHDDDFEKNQNHNLTGHEIAKYIKKKNAGNQIVVFTASNKIWNLKEEIFKIGASGYAMKESPDLNLKRQESLSLYQEFASAIKQACKMSYLKDLVDKQNSLKGLLPSITQLDSIVNLLSRDQGKNDQDLLGAALLAEMVFIEDFIKNQLGYELLSTGEGATLKVSLCSKKQKEQYQQLVTGHIFFKRIQNGSHSSVVDVSEYSASTVDAPSGMCDVTGSDISLVTAVLMMIFNLPRTLVKKYVDLKFIRNTQIAHAGTCERKVTSELIVDFYLTIICPIVMKRIPTQ